MSIEGSSPEPQPFSQSSHGLPAGGWYTWEKKEGEEVCITLGDGTSREVYFIKVSQEERVLPITQEGKADLKMLVREVVAYLFGTGLVHDKGAWTQLSIGASGTSKEKDGTKEDTLAVTHLKTAAPNSVEARAAASYEKMCACLSPGDSRAGSVAGFRVGVAASEGGTGEEVHPAASHPGAVRHAMDSEYGSSVGSLVPPSPPRLTGGHASGDSGHSGWGIMTGGSSGVRSPSTPASPTPPPALPTPPSGLGSGGDYDSGSSRTTRHASEGTDSSASLGPRGSRHLSPPRLTRGHSGGGLTTSGWIGVPSPSTPALPAPLPALPTLPSGFGSGGDYDSGSSGATRHASEGTDSSASSGPRGSRHSSRGGGPGSVGAPKAASKYTMFRPASLATSGFSSSGSEDGAFSGLSIPKDLKRESALRPRGDVSTGGERPDDLASNGSSPASFDDFDDDKSDVSEDLDAAMAARRRKGDLSWLSASTNDSPTLSDASDMVEESARIEQETAQLAEALEALERERRDLRAGEERLKAYLEELRSLASDDDASTMSSDSGAESEEEA